MKLTANYSPLGDQQIGDTQSLWGINCVLSEVGSKDVSRLAYVVDVEAVEAKALLETKRFTKAS